MGILPNRSLKNKNSAIAINCILSFLILLFSEIYWPHIQKSYALEDNTQPVPENDDAVQGIVNPFDSDCYDWRGEKIPCDFKESYSKLLFYKTNPGSRFTDNKDGTVTDNLTKIIWLKNTNCFGMLDWQSAISAAKSLEEGECGPDPDFILSDGSSPGDWRLPTMKELCTLIDFSRRDPSLPDGHMFSETPAGYHWSATTLEHYPEQAWIVYFESGTTCYENVKNRAGHIWPVRVLKK